MNLKVEVDPQEIDFNELTRDLDRTKSSVFMSDKNAAFLGSLMCSLNFLWTNNYPTAATDGINLMWNPSFFQSLVPLSRETVLQHELWHVGLLHNIRRGTRDPGTWNKACDIKINLMLEAEKCTFVGVEDARGDPKYIGWIEEDIYDDLIKQQTVPPCSGCCTDKVPVSDINIQATINNVVQAIHQAKAAGVTKIPGQIEEIVKQFLEPQIPWQTVLMQFFTDLLQEDYSWKRPNRRYSDIYLPSRCMDDGRLEHLIYYLDVSGSCSETDVIRFNSEVKYIQEVLKPKRLTLVQFDDSIQATKEFKEEDPFDEIQIVGRGGTLWEPVREHIEKHKPTTAIVFTDMGFFDAIIQPNIDVPLIWIAINKPGASAPFGKILHIR